jgi:deoxyribodipyrimidine photo-lyase
MTVAPAVTGSSEHSGVRFEPTRAAGLARLEAFVPHAAHHYAERRNFDLGPDQRDNVSLLSPWVRHRLVREDEIVRSVLDRHSFRSAEKFVQEVAWRTYWKGWLEMRPSVWARYRNALEARVRELDEANDLRCRWEDATSGRTGIRCFDAWVRELVDVGYLHNHTRMWFASIWIFTLKLPWELGADFFLRHLVDGDPASNTLSWRWVAGLQTRGKTYLAQAGNISKFTAGRFKTVPGLATVAEPLADDWAAAPAALPPAGRLPNNRAFGLLVTEDDCDPLSLGLPIGRVRTAAGIPMTHGRSPLPAGERPAVFSAGAIADALERARDASGCPTEMLSSDASAEGVIDWARSASVDEIVTGYVPVGPTADWLHGLRAPLDRAGISLTTPRRIWDDVLWPHATRGFFPFKEKLPAALRDLGIG